MNSVVLIYMFLSLYLYFTFPGVLEILSFGQNKFFASSANRKIVLPITKDLSGTWEGSYK